MTTLPKARRFHTSANDRSPDETGERPSVGSGSAESVQESLRRQVNNQSELDSAKNDKDAAERERLMQNTPYDDGFGDFRLVEERKGNSDESATDSNKDGAVTRQAELEAIRAENLSPRQMRIARRIARMHKIEVHSDEEAVLELRKRDIDPSHRAALGKVLSDDKQKGELALSPGLPAVQHRENRPPAKARPPGGELTPEARAMEVHRIQRELAKRRRWRMAMLAVRLFLFVIFPTAITGWYYFMIATPLYETQSQFQIQVADSVSASGAGGGLLSSALSVNTDAVGLQSYLMSRVAMARLDEDLGFKEVFQDPSVDPIKRLQPDASNEDAYKVYQDSVKVSYDPTEGVVEMKVIAPSAKDSEEFSRVLLRYAEEQVDHMTSRLREDQMKGARENYDDAETKMLDSQTRVLELQEQLGVLDPAAESSVVMSQVSQMETQIITKQLELGQLLANPTPVQSRVDALRGDIVRLKKLIAETRQELTQGGDNSASLAKITGELRIAEGDLLTRQTLLASAAEQMEMARIEANKQVRYLSLSVPPVAPDEATYPKAFQNSVVAFIIFSGIYLMLSLTVSILREQVST